MQASALAFGLNVPGAQGVSPDEPTLQKVPGEQMMHWSTLVIVIDAFLIVPPGHGSDAAAPAEQ